LAWQYIYLVILFVAALISMGIAFYAWLNRDRPGLILFAGMMLSVSIYCLTAGLMSSAATPQGAERWVNLHYLGLTSMMAFYITFILQFIGHKKWVNKFSMIVFFAVPVITQIIIETNPLHHWFIKEIEFQQDGILMGLFHISYGGFFWFHTVYSYTLVLVGIGLMIARSVRTFKLYRVQSLTLCFAMLAPLLGSINDSRVFIVGFPFPIVPIGFAMMGILIAWNVFRNQMLNIIPVARDTLVESMSDSMIVMDVAGQVIDINPAALHLLKKSAIEVIGKPVEQVFNPWQETLKQFQGKTKAQGEISITQDTGPQHFDVQISPLQGRHGRISGQIIILRDITKRVMAEKQAQEALTNICSLQEQLYKHSIHDALTGLYNRRYLDEVLPREIANATRAGSPISFVMMDIDHFKNINDTFGHAVGDQVLQELSTFLKEQTRIGDLIFRYGGEEFLVLLINTKAPAAYQFAERWRQALEVFRFTNTEADIYITMSMGVAEFTQDGNSITDVLLASDRALYQAKAMGRNHVSVYKAEKAGK
jgi:diguanylate cyclase (GGDEF)-like protein/PAS domain S-box-containing protein